jgi:hypothetical protein
MRHLPYALSRIEIHEPCAFHAWLLSQTISQRSAIKEIHVHHSMRVGTFGYRYLQVKYWWE